ncbi:MAG: hypothetical protein U0586_14690 [Candidatus Brocadiaceae bacterium]
MIEKDGYDPVEVQLVPKPGGWYIGGNIFFGGLIGYLAVDPATEAMWALTPKKIETTLAEKHASLPDTGGLVISLKDEVPDNLVPLLTPLTN